MSSDLKFVGGLVVFAILAIGGFAIFQNSSKGGIDPARHVEASTLADAGQLIREDSYKKGLASSKVTLVEFGDYQCPACKAADSAVAKIVTAYGDRITFVFRHFPLSNHKFSQLAATAAEAAGKQGKYWEMHEKLYVSQDDWSVVSTTRAVNLLVGYAGDLGLNTDDFRKALTEREFDAKIARDLADDAALNLEHTPTFFVNGQVVELSGIQAALDAALK